MSDRFYLPYDHIPTLSERKRELLRDKFAEKSVHLDPNPPVRRTNDQIMESLARNNSNANLLDIAQSSLIQSGGILADFGKEMSNRVLGTEFDASQKTGFSNRQIADEIAGVSPQQRLEGEQLYEDVYQKSADVLDRGNVEDYIGLAGSALKAGPYFAADSAATLAEYGVGAAATAVGGAGAPILGRRLFKTGQAIDKAADRIDDIRESRTKAKALKEANEAGKAFRAMKNLPKATAKAASQASILAADLTQRGIHEYEQEHGEAPSNERVAIMGLGKMVTTIVEPAIISKLFIGSFRKQLANEGKSLMKHVKEPAAVRNIIDRVARFGADIFKAGAAEAGQEYVQTWEEIISVGMTPEEADDLRTNLVKYIENPEHQKEALTGGAIGLGAGASVKGAIGAPQVAAGTAVDTTIGTAKVAAKTAGKVAKGAANVANTIQNRIDLNVISDEERQEITNKYNIRKEITDKKVTEQEDLINTVDSAKTVDDLLNDEALSPLAKKAMEELDMVEGDLSKSGNLKKVKDRLTRKFKAQQTTLKAELEASNLARQAKAVGKGIRNRAIDAAKATIKAVPQSVVEKTVAAKIKTQAAVTEAIKLTKELNSSTAYGVIEMALNGTTEQTRTALTAAGDLSISDIERVGTIISKHNPKLGKQFQALAEKKKVALGRVGLRNENLINEETIDVALKNLVEEGTFKKSDGPAIAQVISNTMDGRIDDQAALDTAKKALEIYENSEAFNDKEAKGRLTDHTMGVYKKRLENAQKRINRKGKTVVNKVAETGRKWWVKAGEFLADSAFNLEAKERLKDAEEKGPEEVKKVQTEIDNARAEIREARAKAEQASKETPSKPFSEKVTDFGSSVKDTVVGGVKAVKEGFREKKVIQESETGLYPQLKSTSNELQKEDFDTAGFAPAIPAMAAALRKAGYENIQDLNDLVTQFPGLKANEEIYELLQAEFDTEVVLDEDTDINLRETPLKTVAANAIDTIKKKLLRCK